MPLEATWGHCNSCGRSTSHDVLASEKSEGTPEPEGGFVPYDHYEMLKCRGCRTVTLRLTSKWSPDEPPSITYYPPAVARRRPDWAIDSSDVKYHMSLIDSDDKVTGLYHAGFLMREVYVAVQNNARRLAAMGIRAALESVMIDKVGDKGSFKANMDAFQAADYVNGRQRGHLEAVLAAGDAAIHRGWEPTHSDIVVLLDITEAIIEGAYLHDQPADTLSRAIPSRPPRSPRKSE